MFASIGVTALQLEHMNLIHWSARACCVASMVLGVASVTTATKQHQVVGMLRSALEIRLWLSRGKPTLYLQDIRRARMTTMIFPTATLLGLDTLSPLDILFRFVRRASKIPPDSASDTLGKYTNLQGFRGLPLESSLSALKAVALPRHLLDLAVILFMVGIGLYELFCWKQDAGNDGIGYRNVFIVFVIALGLWVIYDLGLSIARIADGDKRNSEFDMSTLGGTGTSEKLRHLEKQLAEIRRDIALEARWEDMISENPQLFGDVNAPSAEQAAGETGSDSFHGTVARPQPERQQSSRDLEEGKSTGASN